VREKSYQYIEQSQLQKWFNYLRSVHSGNPTHPVRGIVAGALNLKKQDSVGVPSLRRHVKRRLSFLKDSSVTDQTCFSFFANDSILKKKERFEGNLQDAPIYPAWFEIISTPAHL
jgi:hypothetical protein